METWTATYDLPSSEPGRRWDPDAHVRLRLTAHGPEAAQARARLAVWMRRQRPAEEIPAGHAAVTGGAWAVRYGVGTAEEPLLVEVHSAGEDGVESASACADEITDLLAGLDVEGAWEALPLRW